MEKPTHQMKLSEELVKPEAFVTNWYACILYGKSYPENTKPPISQESFWRGFITAGYISIYIP